MLKTYTTGYLLSLLCTVAAFALVQVHLNTGFSSPSRTVLLLMLVALAVAQLTAQLVFFLHFGKESKPWNRFVFAFALLIVIFIVGGSFWIMTNLQHNQMQEPFRPGPLSPQTER